MELIVIKSYKQVLIGNVIILELLFFALVIPFNYL
jgi:hypothetical protein